MSAGSREPVVIGAGIDPLLVSGRGITLGAISVGSRADFAAINRAIAMHHLHPGATGACGKPKATPRAAPLGSNRNRLRERPGPCRDYLSRSQRPNTDARACSPW